MLFPSNLTELYQLCRSTNHLLELCGIRNNVGTRAALRRELEVLSLSWEELNSRWKRVSSQIHRKSPLRDEEVFIAGSPRSTGTLKSRYLKTNPLNECAICGMGPEWQGKRLTLVLDHINGEHTDNRLENLRLLCPNCNAQTPTFGRRAKGKKLSEKPPECSPPTDVRVTTGSVPIRAWPSKEELIRQVDHTSLAETAKAWGVSSTTIRRKIGNHQLVKRQIRWPPLEQLKQELANCSMVQLAKALGVSDVGLRKHLAKLGAIPTKPKSA